jgi:exopolyphosphatase/guanosine-5'-triphosphate,3'-diphosphate pyrophosphatase
VVAAQRALAVSLGARTIRCVATASVRRAANAPELVERIRRECDGLDVEVVSGKDEARLAFLGAVRTLARPLDGRLVVVDVGGGSSELVVGTPEDGVQWWASVALGSGTVADAILASDPPGRREFARARELVSDILRGVSPPPADLAVAVGGSATSLLRLVGPVLDSAAFARSLELLGSRGRAEVATAFDLDVERVRLMPAGLLILEGVSKLLGMPLHVGQGGLREGALLEAEV